MSEGLSAMEKKKMHEKYDEIDFSQCLPWLCMNATAESGLIRGKGFRLNASDWRSSETSDVSELHVLCLPISEESICRKTYFFFGGGQALGERRRE